MKIYDYSYRDFYEFKIELLLLWEEIHSLIQNLVSISIMQEMVRFEFLNPISVDEQATLNNIVKSHIASTTDWDDFIFNQSSGVMWSDYLSGDPAHSLFFSAIMDPGEGDAVYSSETNCIDRIDGQGWKQQFVYDESILDLLDHVEFTMVT